MAKKKISKEDVKNHPNNPANQPFNVKPNHTSKGGWWKKFK